MLRSRAISGLDRLQLLEGTGESRVIESVLEGEMVQMRAHAQAFHLDIGPQTGEEMVALRAGRLGRRFGKPEVALDGLVIHFDFPPFLVDRLDLLSGKRDLTTL